jgi:ABC-type transport system involved in multi-copper enzyme maturation permease subunit
VDWIRIAIVILLSVLYLSIFVALGLFVSSLMRSSAASLVILLLAWAVMVVVIPDTGGTLATSLAGLIDESDLVDARAAQERALQQYDARHPNAGSISGNWSPRESLGKSIAVDDARMRVRNSHRGMMIAQVRIGYNVTRVSPTAIYRRAVEAIAGSGIDHYESFVRQSREYKDMLRAFLLDHYPLDLHRPHDGRKLADALSTRLFTAADVPKFVDRPIPMGDSMRNSMWDIAILFISSVVFFMAAYISFLKRDVR